MRGSLTGNDVMQTTFEEVLANPDAFSSGQALYLQEGAGWALGQAALVIDPDAAEDKGTPVGELVIRDRWQYILEISVVRSVVDFLSEHKPGHGVHDRLLAFVHYFENDAFLELTPPAGKGA